MVHSEEFRRFVATLTGTLAALTVLWAAVVFALAYIRESSRVLTDAKRELSLIESTRRFAGESKEMLLRMSAERSLVASAFAPPEDPLPLIERIESLGRSFGVTTDLSVGSGEISAFALVATGEFSTIFRFLSALESFDYLISFGDAEIRRETIPQGAPVDTSYVRLILTFTPVYP